MGPYGQSNDIAGITKDFSSVNAKENPSILKEQTKIEAFRYAGDKSSVWSKNPTLFQF